MFYNSFIILLQNLFSGLIIVIQIGYRQQMTVNNSMVQQAPNNINILNPKESAFIALDEKFCFNIAFLEHIEIRLSDTLI